MIPTASLGTLRRPDRGSRATGTLLSYGDNSHRRGESPEPFPYIRSAKTPGDSISVLMVYQSDLLHNSRVPLDIADTAAQQPSSRNER